MPTSKILAVLFCSIALPLLLVHKGTLSDIHLHCQRLLPLSWKAPASEVSSMFFEVHLLYDKEKNILLGTKYTCCPAFLVQAYLQGTGSLGISLWGKRFGIVLKQLQAGSGSD